MDFLNLFPIIEKDLYKDFIIKSSWVIGFTWLLVLLELPELLGFYEESARKKVFELSTVITNILAKNATKQALNVSIN